MTPPADLARQYTSLDFAARNHLDRLMGSWGMLADLSFSDLLLYVPITHFEPAEVAPGASFADPNDDVDFVVLGQMRPTTSQTLFELDLVGEIVATDRYPLVRSSFRTGAIMTAEGIQRPEGHTRYQSIPVRWNDEVVAVLNRVWSPIVGRRTGGLERTYINLFDRFAMMVNNGIFPFFTDEAAVEEAPRVGDGVMVLDKDQRVTFASPNAVNALHRLGIVSAIVGASLPLLGVDTEAVSHAYLRQVPVIEEVERRGDVIVLLRCIPLIDDGVVSGAALLLRDVTDLRRRDRLLLSKDAAIREVHHRVKNNLQTISSLLHLQSRRLEDKNAQEALMEAERRISAIALVHEILAHEPGEQVPFDEIVPALIRLAQVANMTTHDVTVRVVGDAGDLVADVATPLAVVLAELLQNAVEHAFENRDSEEQLVEVRFTNSEGSLAIEIRDNGTGFPEGFTIDASKSLGLAIVRDLVCSQLGGTITVETAEGAIVRIVIPLSLGSSFEGLR